MFYVYAYLRANDSKTAVAGTPYYIGKGKCKRAIAKHRCGVPDKSRIVIIESNLSEVGAFALERRLIAWYGRKDLSSGILTNLTDGGEGQSGRVFNHSQESRSKISVANKGRVFSEAHKANLRGPKTDEQCRKISKGKTGKTRKPFSPETIEKMKQAQAARQEKIRQYLV
jgi:hypothetical protein